MMIDDLKALLKKAAPAIDMTKVTEDTRLYEDLNLDSLAVMMFSMEIEDAYKFKFTEPVQLKQCATYANILQRKALPKKTQ